MRKFRDRLKKELQDPAFKKAYEEEEVLAGLAIQIARLRQQNALSQKELAGLLHISQQMVSRLEDPYNGSFSLKTLLKLAKAFNKKLSVQFV